MFTRALTGAASLLFIVMGLGCTASPKQLCQRDNEVVCDRVFECFSQSERTSSEFISRFGSNRDECRSKLNAKYCSDLDESNPCMDRSKVYHPDRAMDCTEDFNVASCETIRGGYFQSSNCDKTCAERQ